MSSLMKNCSR